MGIVGTTFAVKNLKFSVPEYGGCGDWCREVSILGQI